MILISDIGGTKGDWVLIDKKQVIQTIETPGFNPFTHNAQAFTTILKEKFSAFDMSGLSHVFYYGTGTREKSSQKKVIDLLSEIFPKAIIEVNIDLLASARATCQRDKGIACILGTGANSCVYDGEKIIDNIPTLGYILGDEGSGAHFGKLLIKSYFYKEMPQEIRQAFEEKFPGKHEFILNQTYHHPPANQFLASFTLFAADYRDHPFIQTLLSQNFQSFIDTQVSKYPGFQSFTINAVGSVAWHFSEEFSKTLQKNGCTLGSVIAKPIDELINFHSNE